jgi:hypothetical protein
MKQVDPTGLQSDTGNSYTAGAILEGFQSLSVNRQTNVVNP